MMKRVLIAVALVLSSGPAYGQGSVMPIPLAQWFDNNGAVLTSGGLCVFRAGTSTAASTYTTAALTIANTNPILFSNGRASSGGVFLTPGESYKFELRDYAATVGSPTCGAGVGATIWTVDNVTAVPGSAAAVDVTATAGEAIAAGEAVFLSTGAGALNAGQWYKTDSDLTYRSSVAIMVGLAPNAIASAASGTVRVVGAVTVAGPLSPGQPYFLGATAGAIVTTPPTNALRIGAATSTTSLLVGYTKAPVGPRGAPCGRLTLTTGVPVTIADVTAATTIFYAPYGCNQIDLFNGTNWESTSFAQLSIAVPATTATMYDVFVYDNAGVLALELTAWTNDTTRATALTTQDGIYVKTGVTTRRYLGSFRTLSVSGQTEDSLGVCRCVYNYYNRVPRQLQRLETTANWAYTVATWRQARASALNQIAFVVGVAEEPITATIQVVVRNDNAGVQYQVGFGLDSTVTPAANTTGLYGAQAAANIPQQLQATYRGVPAAGYHVLAWLERSDAGVGITTWFAAAGLGFEQSGILAWVNQ